MMTEKLNRPMKPCPHCNEFFGKITDNSPKNISFENKNYRIDVDRTWEGMNWGEPSGYTLHHWCTASVRIKVRGKTMSELERNWEEAIRPKTLNA